MNIADSIINNNNI